MRVVITDTFGRAWREGVVNVAVGCAGLPALVDLRGSADDHGRALEATVVALADEVAAASGLVMTKAARTPAAIVRGLVVPDGMATGRAADLIRAPADDLFRTGEGGEP
jgi:coenzyme F420-0:L-glutamate ligase/coenzyme F420-1:gamma-L-glutamate ligase